MSTTEHEREAQELITLAGKIATWQQSVGWTKARMVREYPGIGSDKTFTCLADGKVDGFDVETQLAAYRAVWATIEVLSGDGVREQLYEDMGPVVQIRRAMLEVMRSRGNARVLIVLGASGVGKSAALTILNGRYAPRCLVLEACDVWRDSPSALLGEILRSLGMDHDALPPGRVERLEKAIELLCRSPRCMIVDEAHHLGPHCLNTIKTLVNRTPGEFVLVAIPTLWGRLESQAYSEARQISTNRLSERLRLDLTEADIARYLRHVFPDAAEDVIKAGAKVIRSEALGNGNMAFVRDVAGVARSACKADTELTASDLSQAVATAKRRR